MNTSTMLEAVIPVSQEGLTFSDILRNLPADPGSIFALILMVAFFGVAIHYGTRPGKPRVEASPEATDPLAEPPGQREAMIR